MHYDSWATAPGIPSSDIFLTHSCIYNFKLTTKTRTTMKSKTLIIGSTGKTGQPVVKQTLIAGLNVRAVIRKDDDRSAALKAAGAETVIGDVHDIKSLRSLVQGVDRIYFAYPPHEDRLVEATANIAIAAKDEGVSHLINMSQLPAREGARSALTYQHWLSENIFDQADIGAIHIRPTFFMENLLLFSSQSISNEGKIYLPYGSRNHAPIAADDIARVVVALLQDPATHAGKRLTLTGPQNLSIAEMANIVGQQVGRAIEYVDLPAAQWRDILIKQVGLPKFLANHLHQVAIDHQHGVFDRQTDTVESITGIAPQPLVKFVRCHLAQFMGKEAIFLGV
jgi:NAD(P)H dehydrogenase (quinone)